MSKLKTYCNWSSGKDAALALYYTLKDDKYDITELVTSVNSHYQRVTMHGLPIDLLQAQTEAIGIKSTTIELPENPSMDQYNQIMERTTMRLKDEGYTHSLFGDIFLEDLKQYRETELEKVGLTGVFPLWKKDTKTLINTFLDLGFKAVIICASAKYLDEDFVGKTLTKDLIKKLPDGVDPCGENGEFHTFCYDGPIFKTPVAFTIGEKTYREYDTPNAKGEKTGFWFCDLRS
ncbi:MAG: diphthine--ammonia ligase [Bizionia sp.]|nr:diphthine--ammonia ligase [Bizionia sp.]